MKANNDQKEKTKKDIINSCRIIIEKEGYSEISIRKVANKADISHSLIRHHFGSKEQLVNSVFLDVKKSLSEVVTVTLKKHDIAQPNNFTLYNFIESILREATKNLQFTRLIMEFNHSPLHSYQLRKTLLSPDLDSLVVHYNLYKPLNMVCKDDISEKIIMSISSVGTYLKSSPKSDSNLVNKFIDFQINSICSHFKYILKN